MDKMKVWGILRNFSRIVTGAVFVFSGFVKGVDPLGTAYRIEDYFIAYHSEWAMGLALPLAVLLCAVEFAVGMALLFNVRMKLTSWLLLLMMVFFTGLTFYDALYEPVPECGCFGDAIVLTNWQTFYKNIVLMVFVLVIFFQRKNFKSLYAERIQSFLAVAFVLGFAFFSLYNYRHLPMVDFRAWKVGNQLNPKEPVESRVYLTYRNKSSGETKEYLSPDYPWNDSVWLSRWEFVDQRTETIGEPPAHGLYAEDADGNNMTDVVLNSPHLFVFVSPHLEDVSEKILDKTDALNALMNERGYTVVWLTASMPDLVTEKAVDHPSLFETYYADETVLKTIIRSNPGLVLMHNGEVLQKWHHNDFPDSQQLNRLLDQLDNQ